MRTIRVPSLDQYTLDRIHRLRAGGFTPAEIATRVSMPGAPVSRIAVGRVLKAAAKEAGLTTEAVQRWAKGKPLNKVAVRTVTQEVKRTPFPNVPGLRNNSKTHRAVLLVQGGKTVVEAAAALKIIPSGIYAALKRIEAKKKLLLKKEAAKAKRQAIKPVVKRAVRAAVAQQAAR